MQIRQDSTPAVLQPPGEFVHITRGARALLGWMQPQEAEKVQAGGRTDVHKPEYVERAARARSIVASRVPGLNQTNLITEPGADLQSYMTRLEQNPAAAQYFQQGWRVCLADLRRVCALQPSILVDQAIERTRGVAGDDLKAIAAISLPIPEAAALPLLFDQARQSWVLSSANPNLRIVGNWHGQIQPGLTGFGFTVSVLPSFIQVARFVDRYVLRDGNHRAYGFLRAGISIVPVLTREFGQFEDLGLPPGLLPTAAYLGERPPFLPDFLDNDVSAEVSVPSVQKTIVVAGLELTTFS
jgi:hypothetical protein